MAKINEIEVGGSLYDLEDKNLTNAIQNTRDATVQPRLGAISTCYSWTVDIQ